MAGIIIGIVVAFVAVVLVRTLRFTPKPQPAISEEAVSFNKDAAIDALAANLTYSLEHKNTGPQNFLGVGGMKIFRDLIYMMRGFMRADHKFFKSHGQYDFPQKQWPKSLAMYLIGAMMANPKLHSKMDGKMNEGMLMPYTKVLKDLDKK